MKTLISTIAVLACISCAHTQVQPKAAPVTEQLVPFNDVMHGLRPKPCVQAPKHYDMLDIAVEACQYNTDVKMPAACVYMGKKLMPEDVLMVCGAIMVQDDCPAKWRPTMEQCALPIEKAENPLNEDQPSEPHN